MAGIRSASRCFAALVATIAMVLPATAQAGRPTPHPAPRLAAAVALHRHTGDPDHDRLPTWFERRRSHTNPHRRDTDGDGYPDNVELAAGSDPRDARSVPRGAAGPASGRSRGAGPRGASRPSAPPHAATPDAATATAPATPAAGPGGPAAPAPVGTEDLEGSAVVAAVTQPSACATGALAVSTARALVAAVEAGQSACVTAAIGDVELDELGDRSGVVISTAGGSIGELDIEGTDGLAVRWARLRAVTIRHSDRVAIEGSTIGGTREHRVSDQLIFMPDRSEGVIIRGNDIGWTIADNSGNTGYGCRCYGETNGLQFVGNYVHDIAADGFQGTNGADVVIDRNKIGPVGANPGSDEHSDNIQIVGNGPGLRITNNWIFQQGWFEGQVVGNSGSIYVHGGTSNPVLIENNLITENQGRTEICGLGTGGTSRSNITIRRNTWIEGGLTFARFPGFEWDCDSGTGNTVAGNIAVDLDGGFAQDGAAAAATFAANIWGTPTTVTFDAQGNCVSANCNPAGAEPIGYRKPSGVAW